jgi:hypothetical protein
MRWWEAEMFPQITYNRKMKRYEYLHPDGGFLTAPSGASNKDQLFQTVISMLDPNLYEAAERVVGNQPLLERVTWKAVALVAQDVVSAHMQGDIVAMVAAADGMGRYAIQETDDYFTCQCVNFVNYDAPMTGSGQRYCKHIMAWRLYQKARLSS